ncbi:MAG: hypothetical protein NPIRA06_10480 [Nitrospirales bacterium]|nr:MAG: hypothetical protein NPIRA06_10480 [Nitrospirales bacterium]
MDLSSANLLNYDHRLNMKSATLDREILWETPSGKQVLIKSRHLASFSHRHLAAISYEVTLLNAEAPIVLSSEMLYLHNHQKRKGDPRQAKGLLDRTLHPRKQVLQDRRITLRYGTKNSNMTLACGMDHDLVTDCAYTIQDKCYEDFGAIVFSIEAKPGIPVHRFKYMTYHTPHTASPEGLYARAERTLDRALGQGFDRILTDQEQFMADFGSRSDIQVSNLDPKRAKRSNIEIQQAIRFNLFHVLQASGRADTTGLPAKGLTSQADEGQYFWIWKFICCPS